MNISHLKTTTSSEEVSAALEGDGAVIVDSVLSAGEVDDVMAELGPWIENTKPGRWRRESFQ
jgi:hypothetical protein